MFVFTLNPSELHPSVRVESEFSRYCWELLRKHVGLSRADILPGHWLGGWKVVSCHSSAPSCSHEWACIAAQEQRRRKLHHLCDLTFIRGTRSRPERLRCRWTYMRWAMHTIHGLCRLCIERNLPQVCYFCFWLILVLVLETSFGLLWS